MLPAHGASRKPRLRRMAVREGISKKETNPECFSTTPFEILFKRITMEWGNGKSGASAQAPGPTQSSYITDLGLCQRLGISMNDCRELFVVKV